jgi:hypothetical protein
MLNILNSEWDVDRRDKADQLRNLVENFSNMSLKDYLGGVIYFEIKTINKNAISLIKNIPPLVYKFRVFSLLPFVPLLTFFHSTFFLVNVFSS